MDVKKTLFFIFLNFTITNSFSQEGKVILNQDPKLIDLMELKKIENYLRVLEAWDQ